jgi:hypothetical protein
LVVLLVGTLLPNTNSKEFSELLALIPICQLAASAVFLGRLVFEALFFRARPSSTLRESVLRMCLLNRVHFDWHMPSPQGDGLAFADDKIRRDHLATEQLSRDDEMLSRLLAILAQPSRDVHGVAEKGELALGAAALAHNHGPAMQRGSELRHDGERALISVGEAGHRAVDRNAAL